MKRYALLLLLAFAGCDPKYTSGKTQCSDKNECPTGFICGNDGTTSVNVCFDSTKAACAATDNFYCAQSKTCWPHSVACSSGAGGSLGTGGIAAGGMGGSQTLATGGITSAGGAGGAGGVGGTSGVVRDAGIRDVAPDTARDATPDAVSKDVGGKDVGVACGTGCTTGQQCLSAQCCTPPAAGGECTTFPTCGCPTGKVCYPSSTTHAMACFVGDNLPEGADCASGLYCQTGFGCFGGVCKRYCGANTDCPVVAGIQSCSKTTWSSDSSDILGVKVCSRICNPAHPQSSASTFLSCPTGFNCTSDVDGLSYCFQANPLPAGSTCSLESDCAAGSYCNNLGICRRYCLTNSDCATGTTCQFTWSPPEYAGTYEVGYCL